MSIRDPHPADLAPHVDYVARTTLHIFLVQRCALRVARAGLVSGPLALELLEQVVHHDRSKWSEEEWGAYAHHWHVLSAEERETEEARAAFAPAWAHHKAHNPHHVGHHAHVDEMSEVDMIHMVCDWAAMSAERGQSLSEWAHQSIPRYGLGAYRGRIEPVVELLDGLTVAELLSTPRAGA
jgi:hypothetical protein